MPLPPIPTLYAYLTGVRYAVRDAEPEERPMPRGDLPWAPENWSNYSTRTSFVTDSRLNRRQQRGKEALQDPPEKRSGVAQPRDFVVKINRARFEDPARARSAPCCSTANPTSWCPTRPKGLMVTRPGAHETSSRRLR